MCAMSFTSAMSSNVNPAPVQTPERIATVGQQRVHPYSGNNARMHPSNKYYRQEPDFHELAARYPDLQQYVSTGSGMQQRLESKFPRPTHCVSAGRPQATFVMGKSDTSCQSQGFPSNTTSQVVQHTALVSLPSSQISH